MFGFNSTSFFLTASSSSSRHIIEMTGIGLVVAEHLGRHIDGGKIVPYGNFSFQLRIPHDVPALGRLRECGGVVNHRVWPPHEGHAVDFALHADKRQRGELRRKLAVAGQFAKIERRRQAGGRNHGGYIAGGRDHVVIARAATAQFGDKFVTRSHVGGRYFAVVLLFESLEVRGIGVAFPDQQVERGSFPGARSGEDGQQRGQQRED